MLRVMAGLCVQESQASLVTVGPASLGRVPQNCHHLGGAMS